MALIDMVELEEVEGAPSPAQASSSPDKVVAGPSNPLPEDEFRAHQELLKRLAVNLNLEVEELKELAHSLIDILAAVVPSRVAWTINKAVMGPIRTL